MEQYSTNFTDKQWQVIGKTVRSCFPVSCCTSCLKVLIHINNALKQEQNDGISTSAKFATVETKGARGVKSLTSTKG